ncbi:metallophosphoesterase family protein [Salinarchaeum laminariae]|uniref:metallophosphoesterase family protein n=1 Tax=Salinarchaeum laminariae TaxID=869888 RepID=UPI0020C084E6|nr:YfcE family phosphodiesterase [Salinarchaeum laminariae]
MPRVAILSDTHIPSRRAALPGYVRDELDAADCAIHAGDFDSRETYETIADLAGDLTAVAGNMDPAMDLPRVATRTVGGVTFVVTHGTGSKAKGAYESRVAGIVREHDPEAVGVSGHTHSVLDTEAEGVRLLNPGSATGAAPADRATMYRADVLDGDLELELLEG